MNLKLINNYRYDYVLIWGNGQKYKKEIISAIQEHSDFEIINIQDYAPKSIKDLVRAVYSYDYAPFWHLKAKTAYLLTTEPKITFIFFKNNNPDEDFLSDGEFRHVESRTLKKFKEYLRNEYNERKDDRRSENHVIHASDNQKQTDYILKYIGYPQGIKSLTQNANSIIKAPYHLKYFNQFTIKSIDINNLYCNILYKDERGVSTKLVKLEESPHYKTLNDKNNSYQEYLEKFQGIYLRDNYSLQSFTELAEKLIYLDENNSNNYILVKENNQNFTIQDGLHRASILKYKGIKRLTVAVIK